MQESFKIPSATFPTVSGSICTFNSQYAGLPLKSHTIAVTATQSGSGTPSPSNPRPISIYSAINISQSGADTSNPTVYTITIGSTVYSGEYDARTGVLTVTWLRVDLGSLAWVENATYPNVFNTYPLTNTLYDTNSLIAEIYELYLSSTVMNYDYGIAISAGLDRLYVKNKDYSTAADFKTAMNGIYVCYKLATPTTIQLPPCPIDTLEVNNIWADTGDTTLQYPKFG